MSTFKEVVYLIFRFPNSSSLAVQLKSSPFNPAFPIKLFVHGLDDIGAGGFAIKMKDQYAKKAAEKRGRLRIVMHKVRMRKS